MLILLQFVRHTEERISSHLSECLGGSKKGVIFSWLPAYFVGSVMDLPIEAKKDFKAVAVKAFRAKRALTGADLKSPLAGGEIHNVERNTTSQYVTRKRAYNSGGLAMRTYDKDFKINSINLYKSSGRSLKRIAQELGLATSTLSKWVDQYRRDEEESFPGKGHVKSYEEEVRSLRKELMHVCQERDILKKAVAIFSGPHGKGTIS